MRETKRGPARPLTHPLSCPLLPSLTLSLALPHSSLALSCSLLPSPSLPRPLLPSLPRGGRNGEAMERQWNGMERHGATWRGIEGQWSGNGRAMAGQCKEWKEWRRIVPPSSARALSLSLPGCLSLSFLARPPARRLFFLDFDFSLLHTCSISRSHTCLLPLPHRAAWRGQWRGNGRAMAGQCKEWKEWRRIVPPPSARALSLSLSLAPAVSLLFF